MIPVNTRVEFAFLIFTLCKLEKEIMKLLEAELVSICVYYAQFICTKPTTQFIENKHLYIWFCYCYYQSSFWFLFIQIISIDMNNVYPSIFNELIQMRTFTFNELLV